MLMPETRRDKDTKEVPKKLRNLEALFKGIDKDALRDLCCQFDRYALDYPDDEYEGLAIYHFFVTGVFERIYGKESEDWWDLLYPEEPRIDPLETKPGGKAKGTTNLKEDS